MCRSGAGPAVKSLVTSRGLQQPIIWLHAKFTFCYLPPAFLRDKTVNASADRRWRRNLMVAKEPAIALARLESVTAVQQSAVAGMRAVLRMRAALIMAIAAAFALMLSTTARAATITVNSLADPGRAGICALRDAITAANLKKATHGCAAGTGNDTIQFKVTG